MLRNDEAARLGHCMEREYAKERQEREESEFGHTQVHLHCSIRHENRGRVVKAGIREQVSGAGWAGRARVRGLPPSPQKKAERMGHGRVSGRADAGIPGLRSATWSTDDRILFPVPCLSA